MLSSLSKFVKNLFWYEINVLGIIIHKMKFFSKRWIEFIFFIKTVVQNQWHQNVSKFWWAEIRKYKFPFLGYDQYHHLEQVTKQNQKRAQWLRKNAKYHEHHTIYPRCIQNSYFLTLLLSTLMIYIFLQLWNSIMLESRMLM